MKSLNRIPQLIIRDNYLTTRDMFQEWCDQMTKQDMLFHFDDEPSDCLSKFNLTEDELERIDFAISTARRSRINVCACALKAFHNINNK